MDRNNPYEAAFEGYLKTQGLCYVGVDEGRRAMLGEMPIKNLDFIVLGACGSRLLIDVKGPQFPGGPPEKPRYVWENWATNDDIVGLRSWLDVFGPGYTALFLFLYRLRPNVEVPADSIDLWTFREQQYLLRAMTLAFELGCRSVIIQPGPIPKDDKDPRRALLTDALLALGQHGDRVGATLALETGREDPEALDGFLATMNTGGLAVTYNPGFLLVHGHDPYRAARLLRSRIVCVHAT